MASVGMLGTGTWGMALSRLLSLSGHDVICWSAIPSELMELSETRRQKNLPDMEIPAEITFTPNIQSACAGRDLIVFAVPSPYVRSTAKAAAPYIAPGTVITDVAKGLEAGTLLTLSEVISSEIPGIPVVALSGPTHAEEVARDLPSTIVAACADERAAAFVQSVFMTPAFRVYTNTDIKGVELCGALKNIIALAAGISDGLGFGDNTRAALITRGLAEMERLGACLGCRQETFAGLAGMGDLIVTATSRHSRNHTFGFLIGQGVAPADAMTRVGMVVEGVNALPGALALSNKYGVEMPIARAVEEVLHHGQSPADAVTALMTRDRRGE